MKRIAQPVRATVSGPAGSTQTRCHRMVRQFRKDELSKASRQLLQLCYDRDTVVSKELGPLLFIEPKSVDRRFERAMAMLDVHCRSGAVAQAIKRGLIELGPIPP